MTRIIQTVWLVFGFSLILFWGCGGESGKADQTSEAIDRAEEREEKPVQEVPDTIVRWEEEEVPRADGSQSSCEDLLAAYNNWVDYYIDVLKQQLRHPLDMDNLQRSAKLSLQSAQWAARELRCNADEAWRNAWRAAGERLAQWSKRTGD